MGSFWFCGTRKPQPLRRSMRTQTDKDSSTGPLKLVYREKTNIYMSGPILDCPQPSSTLNNLVTGVPPCVETCSVTFILFFIFFSQTTSKLAQANEPFNDTPNPPLECPLDTLLTDWNVFYFIFYFVDHQPTKYVMNTSLSAIVLSLVYASLYARVAC